MDTILHLTRFIRHLAVFIFLLVPLMLVGVICLLPVCYLIPASRRRLPYWLRWYDNADQYVGRDTSVYYMICDMGWWPRYKWLAWRNPINYFHYVHLGMRWNGYEVFERYVPRETQVGDGTNHHPGFRYIEVMQPSDEVSNWQSRQYYEYYWIYRYPFKPDVCFRYRLGWKISDNNNPRGSISQWVLVISPWKKYDGK